MADPFRFRTLHRVIGAFVLAALAVVLAGVVLIGQSRHWFERSVVLTLDVPAKELGLLRPGLPVKMLGAPAGEVVVIEPELVGDGQWARVRLEVARSFHESLRADASAVIRTPVAGLLGESFVELVPGTGLVPLASGTSIRARPQEDLLVDARMAVANVAAMAASLRSLVDENREVVQQSLVSLKQSLDRVETLARQSAALIEENRAGIKTTVANAADASAKVPDAIDEAVRTAKAVGDTAVAAKDAVESVKRVVDEAGAMLGENRAGLRLAVDELAPLMAKLDRIAADLGVITDHVSAGKGTVGKLVMDDTAHDQLVAITNNLNERIEELKPLLASITEMKLFLGAEGGGNIDTGSMTGSVYLRLEPKPWKFYQGGISYRSAPRNRTTPQESASSLPVDFNFALGWRWIELEPKRYLISAGGGAIESRIGGWVDMSVMSDDRLTLRVMVRDKWDDRDENDRRHEDGKVMVRATAMARVWRLVYLVGGGDDLADDPAGWIGMRVELLDNDLRNISQAAALVR